LRGRRAEQKYVHAPALLVVGVVAKSIIVSARCARDGAV